MTSRGIEVANLMRDGLAVDDHVEVHDEVSGAALAARALADHLHVRREHLAEVGGVGGRKRRGFRDRSARGVDGPEGENAIAGRSRRLQHRVHEVVADAREPRRRRRHRSARPRASGVIDYPVSTFAVEESASSSATAARGARSLDSMRF